MKLDIYEASEQRYIKENIPKYASNHLEAILREMDRLDDPEAMELFEIYENALQRYWCEEE